MGARHKLLLPWNEGTVIDQVLSAWTSSQVRQTFVIVRRADLELQDACARWPRADIVVPRSDPVDMKQSIHFGLDVIAAECMPKPPDRWLIAPADLPTLTASLINQLIAATNETDGIVAPRFAGRRGHPVSFPWSLLPAVFTLRDDQGIDSLFEVHPVRYVDFPADAYPEDMDTPEEYENLAKRFGQ